MENEIKVSMLPLSCLKEFEQNINHLSRKKFLELQESIKTTGIREPLIVSQISDNKYVILDGNHRFRCAVSLGIGFLPCIIKNVGVSNLLREHITINYFRGEITVQNLINTITKQLDSGQSIIDVADMFGMSPNWVAVHYDMKDLPDLTTVFDHMDYTATLPIRIEREVINKIFDVILERDKKIIPHLLRSSAARIEEQHIPRMTQEIENEKKNIEQMHKIFDRLHITISGEELTPNSDTDSLISTLFKTYRRQKIEKIKLNDVYITGDSAEYKTSKHFIESRWVREFVYDVKFWSSNDSTTHFELPLHYMNRLYLRHTQNLKSLEIQLAILKRKLSFFKSGEISIMTDLDDFELGELRHFIKQNVDIAELCNLLSVILSEVTQDRVESIIKGEQKP